MPVCTVLPRHATSAGMPTLTDTSVGGVSFTGHHSGRGGSACAPSSGCHRSPSSTTSHCWAWCGRSGTVCIRCSRTDATGPGSQIRTASHPSTARTAPLGPSTTNCQSSPSGPAVGRRPGGAQKALQGGRPDLTPHHLLQDRAGVKERGEFVLGRRDSPLAHPRSRGLRVCEVVTRHPIDHRRGVEQGEQQRLVLTARPQPVPYLTSKLLLTGYRIRSSLSPNHQTSIKGVSHGRSRSTTATPPSTVSGCSTGRRGARTRRCSCCCTDSPPARTCSGT